MSKGTTRGKRKSILTIAVVIGDILVKLQRWTGCERRGWAACSAEVLMSASALAALALCIRVRAALHGARPPLAVQRSELVR